MIPRRRWPHSEDVTKIERSIQESSLHTVCEEASCPNRGECFSKKRITFLILGDVCTRSCRFCGVSKGRPTIPDDSEPERISRLVQKLGLKEVVITSVTRDDLPDGGAYHFKRVVEDIKALNRDVVVEVLIPDLKGDFSCVETVLEAGPDILSHNVETVPRLYPQIRPEANYITSLNILKFSSSISKGKVKSGLMVGLGEEVKEVEEVMYDLREHNTDILTIGQYLRPSAREIPVREYIGDELFMHYEDIGRKLGFFEVHAGTFVRSSYI